MTVPLAYNTTRRNWLTFNNLALFNLHTPTFPLILKAEFLLFFILNYRLASLSENKLILF